ncbi:MAG TPA: histidine kinase, partial [Microlunatus sp.]|nr:histidine kinase [Microlunatus sp.]
MGAPGTETGHPRSVLAGSPRWWLLAVAGVVLLAAAGRMLSEQGRTPGPLWMSVALAVSFTPLAWFVLRRAPGHPLGRLMAATGLGATAAALAVCWSAFTPIAWLSQWLWWPPIALIPLTLLVFPDGRLLSSRWRVLVVVVVGLAGVAATALALAALFAPQTLLSTVGRPLPPYARSMVRVALVAIGGVLLATVGVFVSLVVRWQRAGSQERRQLACLTPSAVLLVVGVVLATLNVPGGWIPAVVALPLGITLAILQYSLWDLDLYVHRGLVWIVLIGIAVSVYAVVVTGLERILAPGSSVATLVAAGACAAALLPAERLAQRGLTRLVYGRRDDQYAVLISVARHIEAVRDPLEVLPRFTATLVQTLRVPYAAISLTADPGEDPLVVGQGRRTGGEPQRFAMVAHGVRVGELLVEPRRPGTRFTPAETQLLEGIARHAAVAAEACRHALDLQRARERLVLAREEERRRLRRDLHDGVASALVGAQMLVVASRAAVSGDSRADELLATLGQDLTVCTEEVRSLIDGLRPAALDAGLAAALGDLVHRLSESLPVTLEISGDLDDLPAAVEVVTYRMVTESLGNVIKHARASRAWIDLLRDEETLTVRVRDDGVGLGGAAPPDSRGGVGLSSIRSRVEEVGGRFSTEPVPVGVCC